MLPRRLFFALLAFASVRCASAAESYDVVVYGGSPAGIAAAVTAAREGAKVVIVEPTKWLGGMVTGGLARTDVGKEQTIGGFPREYFARAAALKSNTPMWYAEPHANMQAFQDLLREAKVETLTGVRVQSVERDGTRIKSFIVDGDRRFAGKMFVDASYEGDLMAKAGVSYIVGRESRDQYGEPLAGYYPMPIRERSPEVMASDCKCVGGDGPHYVHGTPCKIYDHLVGVGARMPGVSRMTNTPGAADDLTQSYNFRVVVTQRPELRVPFPKPKNYDSFRYELLFRLIQSYPEVRFARLVHLGEVAAGKFDLNAQGFFSTDYVGGNVEYPDADYDGRDRIRQNHIDYVQGFLWFLGHDERVPQKLRDETNSWGLCKDEFTDNANWPYALYVREARRMIGEYVMKQQDCQSDVTKPDTVGMGSFVIDCHIVQRIVQPDGTVTDEGSFQDAPARPYQIAYRSLTPKRAECENLLVPVCFSASHIAYCSMRMEPVYMALGQASGLAAVAAIHSEQPVQAIDVAALQLKLREQNAVLELQGMRDIPLTSKLPGIVVDDEHAEYVGDWTASNYGDPLDGAARHDQNSEPGKKSARFTLRVPSAGRYEVRLAYVQAPNRATNVPVSIAHADGEGKAVVDQRADPLDGHFAALGTFRFTPEKPAVVTIANDGANGYVAVDAVQLLPTP